MTTIKNTIKQLEETLNVLVMHHDETTDPYTRDTIDENIQWINGSNYVHY